MADIASKVAQIRQATYGKDVRESIASGIEAINTEVVSTTDRQNEIDAQEQTRINNEVTRQSQETTRVNNEATRQSQETTRQSQETTRQSQESSRQTQETNRVSTFIANENERSTTFESNENNRSIQFNALKTDIADATTNANNAATNTNLATSNYNTVVEQTRKIYKPAVNNYSKISTTYPSPEIGWTVTSKDDNMEYRWDGVEWVNIGNSNPAIGLNIVVGTSAPTNPNTIWLEAPETTRYSRVIPSVTEPTDPGQIWWELDN